MKPTTKSRFVWVVFAGMTLIEFAFITPPVFAQNKAVNPSDQAQVAELNLKLAAYLTGSRWEGHFTITGKDLSPTKETYEIIKAEKAEEGDFWNLVARIKYGDNDLTQPLPPIEIKWAGRTPVITVDQVTVLNLGTFDARVVIRKGTDGRPGKYAGTWSHDNIGGHLFGSITRMKKNQPPIEESDGQQKQTSEVENLDRDQ